MGLGFFVMLVWFWGAFFYFYLFGVFSFCFLRQLIFKIKVKSIMYLTIPLQFNSFSCVTLTLRTLNNRDFLNPVVHMHLFICVDTVLAVSCQSLLVRKHLYLENSK